MNKTCNTCGIEKPLDLFHKRASRPSGVTGSCKQCKSDKARDYRERNANATRARSLAYFYKNQGTCQLRARLWRKANPEKSRALDVAHKARIGKEAITMRFRDWAAKNPEKIRANKRRSYARNADKYMIRAAERRAIKLQAIPQWADRLQIGAIYKQAKELTASTGIKYVVDHEVPLKSQFVCGLHVQGNLRVLPFKENAAKSNRWWPDMGSVIGQ